MPTERSRSGEAAEHAAERLLVTAGLRLLQRNVRYRGGEIDRVMADGEVVVFVEVRHRAADTFGGGIGSVDTRKQRRLAHAAALYLQDHPTLADASCRFDVVDSSGCPPRLNWVRDAFRIEA